MDRKYAAIAGAALITAFTGCSTPADLGDSRTQRGVLQLMNYNDRVAPPTDSLLLWTVAPREGVLVPPNALAAPDTVTAGEPFDVVVTTIGMNGCWTAGGQSWRTRQNVIEITATDVHSGANICTEVLSFLEHTSSVTIAHPGIWQLRVQGRRVRQGDHAWEEPVSASRQIFVR